MLFQNNFLSPELQITAYVLMEKASKTDIALLKKYSFALNLFLVHILHTQCILNAVFSTFQRCLFFFKLRSGSPELQINAYIGMEKAS